MHQILDQFGLSPTQALMIGDTEYDLQMASNARMPSLGVDYGVHERERLLKHRPLACLGNIKEIPEWLEKSGLSY